MPILTTVGTIGKHETLLNGAGTYKRKTITQRVTATGYTPSLTVTAADLPPYARIIWATMKPATAISFTIGSSAAQTTAGQMGVAMIWGTAPTAITTSVSTGNLVFLTAQSAAGASIPINQDPVAPWNTVAAATNGLMLATTFNMPTSLNNGTAAKTFYIVPYAATTAAEAVQRFQVATGTAPTVATTGYCFNTSTSATCSFDVQIFYEVFDETPDQ